MIHRGLLFQNAPLIELKVGDFTDLRVCNVHLWKTKSPLEVDKKAFQMFTRFLYRGKIFRTPLEGDASAYREVQELVSAYKCGWEIGCKHFMDAVVDQIIDVITSRSHPFCIDTLVDDLLHEVDKDSILWSWVHEYVLYFRDLGCGKERCGIYFELDRVRNDQFLLDMAERAQELKSLQASTRITDLDLCRMLAVGFREAVNTEDEHDAHRYPWWGDKCEYHQHCGPTGQCYAKQH